MWSWKVSPVESRERVEEREKQAQSCPPWPRALPFLGDTPMLGWTIADRQLGQPHACYRTCIRKHKLLPGPVPPAHKRAAVPEDTASPQLSTVARTAAPQAEVLSKPLSSPRINSEASDCVDLNHRGAVRGGGVTSRDRQADYISPRGPGAA